MKTGTRNIVIISIVIIIAILAGAFLILYNSESAQEKVLPNLEEIREFQVVINLDTANISVEVGIDNPLPADIDIDSIRYIILHDSDTLAKGSETIERALTSGETTYIPLHLGLNYDLIQKKIKQLQGQDSTDIDLNITFFFELPLMGKQSIEIDRTQTVSVPNLPVIEVVDTRVADFGLGEGIEMELTLEVDNNNVEDLHISNLRYHVKVEDFIDARENPDQKFVIKSGTKSQHKVPLHLGLDEAATAAIKKNFGDKTWNVTISGSAEIRSENPMLRHVELKFTKKDVIDASSTGKKGEKGNGNKKKKDNEDKADEKEEEEDRNILEKIKDKAKKVI